MTTILHYKNYSSPHRRHSGHRPGILLLRAISVIWFIPGKNVISQISHGLKTVPAFWLDPESSSGRRYFGGEYKLVIISLHPLCGVIHSEIGGLDAPRSKIN